MNKKADLMDNILTTLIAVVGLVIIIFAAVQLYSAYANQAETNARRTIDSIEGKLGNLGDGQLGRMPVREIEGWFIAGWNDNEDGKPAKCLFKSCICMCEGGRGLKSELAIKCQAKGFCRTFDQPQARVFEISNYPDVTFASSQQDIISFLKNPAGYDETFEAASDPNNAYDSFHYPIVLFDTDGLTELILYKDKETIGFVELITNKGSPPRPAGTGAVEGMTTGSV